MNGQRDGGRPEGEAGKEFGLRFGAVAFLFALLLVAIVIKLLSIQVIDVQKYKKMATRQHEREVVEVAKRGGIVDRAGNRLAESVQKISFFADPYLVRNTPVLINGVKDTVNKASDVAARFARHFGKSSRYYSRKLRKKGRFVWMERSVPIARAQELMDAKIPGVGFENEQQRYYLNLASQVIGLTDRDNRGISGLEKKYHEELKGQEGIRVFQRSATGERFLAAGEEQINAREGLSIQLTIDADTQAIVEDELRKATKEFEAQAAIGIVMDVETGEILAMANYPAFNMNNRGNYRPEKARNRAITDAFEPGSTFKIVMASAATEVLGRMAEDTLDAHNGTYTIHRRVIRDHEKYERMTFREAMEHSSTIIAAKTAMELGAETFYDYVKRFGFGEKTGIDLIGEVPGLLRKPQDWDKTTLPWMGYGYACTATPLQILQAYATVANDGVMMRPYVVSRMLDPDGNVVNEVRPKKVRRVVKSETAEYLRKQYFGPVVGKGTGTAAAIPGVSAAGKTGTAQKLKNGSYHQGAYVSSFVGFFPADKPKIAAIVVIDEPTTAYYASMVAAPVFSRIGRRMIASSEPLKEALALVSPEKQLLDSLKAVAVPELGGLPGRDARCLLKWTGLAMEYEGSLNDIVTGQGVASGTMVDAGSPVKVTLGHPIGPQSLPSALDAAKGNRW